MNLTRSTACCYQALAAEPISECIRYHDIRETVAHIEAPFVVTALAELAFNSTLSVEAVIAKLASRKPPCGTGNSTMCG
jgi:hypothetical protein